jgi:ribosomal protein S18 acetylase RimI-like enzyme
MRVKVRIRDISAEKLEEISVKCADCSFWFGNDDRSLLREILEIKSLLDFKSLLRFKFRERIYKKTGAKKLGIFIDNGGIVKGAFKNRYCVGILCAGSCNLFPRLRSFKVYPPDPRSIFLGCIYVEPSHRGQGIKKRLLIELEKDLIRKKAYSIETIGKRPDDDIAEEEFENSPLLSFKFLINNGFYLKKNDRLFPLLRLDLKSIARDFTAEESVIKKVAYKRAVRSPVIMKEK